MVAQRMIFTLWPLTALGTEGSDIREPDAIEPSCPWWNRPFSSLYSSEY